MATYCLVHGAGFGAWVWERLTPLLEARGHRAIAVDLPCDRQDARLSDYADVVAAGLPDAGGDVVLVGHSLGGLTIPLVAAARPIRQLIFLCAFVPQPGRSLIEQLATEPDMQGDAVRATFGTDEQGRRVFEPEQAVAATFVQDCSRADAAEIWARLRPQGTAVLAERWPLDTLPDVTRSSVLSVKDRVIDPAWSRRVADRRLGVEPLELPGGHCPMLSRPEALASVLVDAGREIRRPGPRRPAHRRSTS